MHRALINHCLQSLIKLTTERDLGELESCLQEALTKLISVYSDGSVECSRFYRLRDITQLFLQAFNQPKDDALPDDIDSLIAREFGDAVLACYNQGEYRSLALADGHQYLHAFPLKHQVTYLNAVVVVLAPPLDDEIVQAICQLLEIFQNYVTLINENDRDTLTGLLNRKTFDIKMSAILTKIRQPLKPAEQPKHHFLAIFDIDHFKKVNDTYGHLIGDEVLLLFSQMMTSAFRETDPLFRFGGEEFVGVFACTYPQDIHLVLERFREKLAHFSFPQVGQVTVSIGCSKIMADSLPSAVIDQADEALYYAKNHGRNQVQYYEQLVAEGDLTEEQKTGEIELF